MNARRYAGRIMDWKPEEEDLIRRYLLDGASDEERRQVEARLLEDDDYGERLLLIEDELIDDCARGALPDGERELFERNFLLTPRRRQDLIVAQEIMDHAAAAEGINNASRQASMSEPKPERARQEFGWRRRLFEPAWKVAAYALLILGLGLVWWLRSGEPEVEKGMAALNQAYAAQRPLEARITGFGHAPFPKLLGAEQNKPDYVALDRAERILLDDMTERPGASAQHALGRLYLAKKEFDKAQTLFNAALQADPNNAQLHSDLGATLFEKWDRERSTGGAKESEETKRQSLEHLTEALRLDGSLSEARFNLALLYQSDNQTRLAREEWRKYVELDPNSPWAKEALDNLERLK
jgi:tetratricopeptide (TPR) repeat protein